MDSSMNSNSSINRWFVMSIVCLSLLLLAGFDISAQTRITATPDSVANPAKPKDVVLHVTQADGLTADTDALNRVLSVNVGDQPKVPFKSDAQQGIITITPPANLSGPQTVQLLDKDGKPLGQVQLTYPSGGGSNASPVVSPTPDINWVRENNAEIRRNKIGDSWWYYPLIIGAFLIVLLAFIGTITKSILFSRATFRSPLGLPVGSFRAILAYTLVAFLGFYVLTSLLTISSFAPHEFLLGIVATVIGFYFGSRTGEEAGGDVKAGTVRGIVRKDGNPASGALVKFKRSDDGTEPYSRITDIDGRFELRGARQGKYKVSATLTGSSASDEQEIAVTEGSDQEIEIVIKSATPTPPAQTGSVQGTVTKPDNSPAQQATVMLSQGGVEKGKATTDTNGKYKIDNVAPGDYDLVASLPGNAPSDAAKVKVAAGAAQIKDLKLK